jgi:Ca2+-binding RTX toxin-like protein
MGRNSYDARLNARRHAVLGRTGTREVSRGEATGRRRRIGVSALVVALLGTAMASATTSGFSAQAAPVGQGFTVTPSDLAYILRQIKIAEHHATTATPTDPCAGLIGAGPDQIPSPLIGFGLRTVDGSCNNLQPGQETFGASDQTFPRLATPEFKPAEDSIPGFGPQHPTSYTQFKGSVFDSQPRLISNLIVDQTSTNPAAVRAAGFPVRTQGAKGVVPCATVPGSDPPVDVSPPTPANCVPAHQTLFIPNVTTDIGLSPPYNSLFTIFGQFFDHGLDKVTNGGSGTVFVPLRTDDPLIAGPDHILGNADDLPPQIRFMVLTRATQQPGPDGLVGTADDIHEGTNTDSPWVDLSQAYTSHASHQVFLREYANDANGQPQSTGRLLGHADGAMANWGDVKAQAATLLGLQLVDTDVNNIPMIAADPYGNFIPGPARGLPQYVTASGLVEGDTAAPVAVPADALRINTAFLNDIAHSAGPAPLVVTPTGSTCGDPGVICKGGPDADLSAGLSLDTPVCPVGVTGCYDNELLDLHVIAGDGRANENIGLTSIHTIFEHEHNRLVGDIENVLTNDTSPEGVAALAEWKTLGTADGWNGARIFQAARFVTEMEYQHLVFEEFARKVQPAINPFNLFAFNSTATNPAIKAEFAHAVYRFGHSMLNETIARTNVDGTTNDIALLDGFLNPASFKDVTPGDLTAAGGDMGAAGAGAIVMGLSDQTGNELDEFVSDTLRNNLLGLPLDLASLNMTRARSEGVPSLNNLRKQVFAQTNDGQLTPYTNWVDFGLHIKHPESLINFVAAYGQHPTVRDSGPDNVLGNGDDVTTLAAKRAAARAIVDPLITDVAPDDAADFMNSTGAWANTAGDVSITGLDNVDLWVGGLAENTNPFGGLLGSTFNYVFELQLTQLQDDDRLYYLNRTPGMNLRTQLEGNSFAELVMRNTTATSLKADSFATADCKFEIANLTSPAAPGSTITGVGSINDDPASECNENRLLIKVSGQIRYRPVNGIDPAGINGQSVYNGTDGPDLIGGGNDNDTFRGNGGNDVIQGNAGDDQVLGGDGNDIVTDLGGDDTLKGGPGNDALDGGIGLDLLLGGDGNDLTVGGANTNVHFTGPGNDFVLAGQGADEVTGDSGDDWMEGGEQTDLLQGDSGSLFFDDHNKPGNDIMIGQSGDDDYDMEGGDDIGVGGPGIEKVAGAAGFDWLTGVGDPQPQDTDLQLPILGLGIPLNGVRDRFNEVEALSGWNLNDTIRGDDIVPAQRGGGGFIGCDALDQAGLDRITGLDPLVPALTVDSAPIIAASATLDCPLVGNVWGDGNILLGGAGSDIIEGRGANDIIDGDRFLNVRLSVRTDPANPATQIGTTDLLEHTAVAGGTFGPGTSGMTLQQAVFAGLVDPGNIVAVREIVAPTVSAADCDAASPLNCDSALFSGPQSDYTIALNGDGSVTVTHNPPAGGGGGVTANDGIDTLRNVEQVIFCDVPGVAKGTCDVRSAPVSISNFPSASWSVASLAFAVRSVGAVATTQAVTLTNTGGANLSVNGWSVSGANAASFTAVSNCITLAPGTSCTFTVSFVPTAAGALSAQVDVASNAGTVTLPLTGIAVVNNPATGLPTISDVTPTEGTALNGSALVVADVDGLPGTLKFQWQQGPLGGGVAAFTNIVGATTATFKPLQAQVNRSLQLVVTFVDNLGAAERVVSLPTTVVGDLFPGIGDSNVGVNVLTGTAGEDEYHGGASNDNLSTGNGNDIISGDAGDDIVATGNGDDQIWFTGTADGFDTITGGAGADMIHARSANTNIGIRSIATVESISSDGFAGVRILGSPLNDVLNFSAVTLTGIEAIDGGGGNDSLTGSGGDDVIIGRAGSDVLNGGAGVDILEGGAGNDAMNAGAGNDFFRFLGGFGADTVTGFDANPVGGQDLIDLRGLGITAATFASQVTITNAGGGSTLITVVGQGTVRLSGVTLANVTITDFVLA